MKSEARPKAFREVVSFIAVGIAATLTHYIVGVVTFYLLPLGLSALWANFIAFGVAFFVTYFGNAIFVFPETRLGPASFLRFLSISVMSLALNQSMVYVLVELLDIEYWKALIPVFLVVPPATFLGLKFWGVRGMGPVSR